jgi:hypothetical protein
MSGSNDYTGDLVTGLVINTASPPTYTVGTQRPPSLGTSGDVIVNQADLSRLIDSVAVAIQTDKLMENLTALTPKFAVIDVAGSGDNTLVAAVTDKKIRVVSLFIVASAVVTARFESGAGGTALTGQMILAENGGFSLPFNPVGWFQTAASTLLNLELSGAVSVDGCLTYVEVT